MNIKSIGMRISVLVRNNIDFIVESGRLIVVALLFFGSGILFAQHYLFPTQSFTIRQDKPDFTALEANVLKSTTTQQSIPKITQQTGLFVASRNGKKYYKITCSNTIKEENKVYFNTVEDAQNAGYTPSATCFK